MSATLTGTDAGSAPDPRSGAGSGSADGRTRSSGRVRRSWTEHGLVFTAPFLVVYALFLVWPLLYGVAGESVADKKILDAAMEPVTADVAAVKFILLEPQV